MAITPYDTSDPEYGSYDTDPYADLEPDTYDPYADLDPDNYEPPDPDAGLSAVGRGVKAVKQGFQSVGSGFGKAVTGTAVFMENQPKYPVGVVPGGYPMRDPFFEQKVKRLQDAEAKGIDVPLVETVGETDMTRAMKEHAQEVYKVDEGRPLGFFSDVINGVAEFIPSMALSAASGGLGTAATFMQIAGGKYDQYIEEGKDEQTARDAAIFSALLTTPVEQGGNLLQIGKLKDLLSKGADKTGLSAGFRRYMSTLVTNALTEGAEEVIQNNLDIIADTYANNPDEDPLTLAGKVWDDFATVDNLVIESGKAFAGGVLGGLMLSGGVGGVQQIQNVIDNRKKAGQEVNESKVVEDIFYGNMKEMHDSGQADLASLTKLKDSKEAPVEVVRAINRLINDINGEAGKIVDNATHMEPVDMMAPREGEMGFRAEEDVQTGMTGVDTTQVPGVAPLAQKEARDSSLPLFRAEDQYERLASNEEAIRNSEEGMELYKQDLASQDPYLADLAGRIMLGENIQMEGMDPQDVRSVETLVGPDVMAEERTGEPVMAPVREERAPVPISPEEQVIEEGDQLRRIEIPTTYGPAGEGQFGPPAPGVRYPDQPAGPLLPGEQPKLAPVEPGLVGAPPTDVGPEDPYLQFEPPRRSLMKKETGPTIAAGVLARGEDPKLYTMKELRSMAEERNLEIPKGMIKKSDIIDFIKKGVAGTKEKTPAAKAAVKTVSLKAKDTLEVKSSDRINKKYEKVLGVDEGEFTGRVYEAIENKELTPKDLDKFLRKSDNKRQDIARVKTVIADQIGELIETHQYEGQEEGAVIEDYIDSLLDVVKAVETGTPVPARPRLRDTRSKKKAPGVEVGIDGSDIKASIEMGSKPTTAELKKTVGMTPKRKAEILMTVPEDLKGKPGEAAYIRSRKEYVETTMGISMEAPGDAKTVERKKRLASYPKEVIEELRRDTGKYTEEDDFVDDSYKKQRRTQARFKQALAKKLGGKYTRKVDMFEQGLSREDVATIGDYGHRITIGNSSVYFIASSENGVIYMPNLVVKGKGSGLGTRFMKALKETADETGQDISIYKVTNPSFFQRFKWLKPKYGGRDNFEYDNPNKYFVGVADLQELWDETQRTKAALEKAAEKTNTSPTQAQIDNDSYAKGKVELMPGVTMAMENPKGSTRKGVSEEGQPWTSKLAHHYGEIQGYKNADGDLMDVFVGPNLEADNVYVVHQIDPKTGKFDEYKVMYGFDSEKAARTGYLLNYPKGWKGARRVQTLSKEEFIPWLKKTNNAAPPAMPTLRTTGDAVKYAKIATKDQLAEAKRLQDMYAQQADDMLKAGKPQEAMDAAVKGQFWREYQEANANPDYFKLTHRKLGGELDIPTSIVPAPEGAELQDYESTEIVTVGIKAAVKKGLITKDEADFITGVMEQWPSSWKKHFKVKFSEQQLAPTAEQQKAAGYKKRAKTVIRSILKPERIGRLKEDARHVAVMFKGSNSLDFIHEIGEFLYDRALTSNEKALVKELFEADKTKPTAGMYKSEWFSREFEKWWVKQKPMDKGLTRIFRKVLASIKTVYDRIRKKGKSVHRDLANLFDDIITKGADIKEKYYYTDREIVYQYVIGTEPSQATIDSQGFSGNSKTLMSWDPSSQCPKQAAFVDFIHKQIEEGGLSIEDLANTDVISGFYDAALLANVDVPCSYCYVEQARRKAVAYHQAGGKIGKVNFAMAKQIYRHVPYKGAILGWNKAKIRKINKRGGLRLFSFSDYIRSSHLEEVTKILQDAEKKGLSIKAITKNPHFVEDFGYTGITINMSIDTLDKGFGMDWDKALEYKRAYPNVMIRSVGLNLEEVQDMLKLKYKGEADFIDIVTPYHHDDTTLPVPEGYDDMAHNRKKGKELKRILDKNDNWEERTCCQQGGKCFHEGHNAQCVANCGLGSGNLSVPQFAKFTQVTVPNTGKADIDLSSKPWYSDMEKKINAVKQETATPEQWKGMINKLQIKQEEIAWVGLEDWLQEKIDRHKEAVKKNWAQTDWKVTKQEILDFVRANNVEVQEVEKEDPEAPTIEDHRRYESLANRGWARLNEEERIEFDALYDFLDQDIEVDSTKYREYQLPGGENYKELLLTLPVQPKDRFAVFKEGQLVSNTFASGEEAREWGKAHGYEGIATIRQVTDHRADYRSSHWDEPNVLAHVRFNERTGPNGERILFIEEVQSDLHQEGRKSGYRESGAEVQWDAAKERVNSLAQKLGKVIERDNLQQDFGLSNFFVTFSFVVNNSNVERLGLKKDTEDLALEYQRAKRDSEKAASKVKAVPDMPFKKSWPLLSMKRMVRYAAENGFDQIAWTPGEVQADRYDLSKRLSRIQYKRNANGKTALLVHDLSGNVLMNDLTEEADLENTLGEELTTIIVSTPVGEEKTLSGLDLKVGSEGMKGFYDKILPSAVNKFFNKATWGKAKVGVGEIEREPMAGDAEADMPLTDNDMVLQEVWTLPLTDEIKQKALTEGMPMFQMSPAQKRKIQGVRKTDIHKAFPGSRVDDTIIRYEEGRPDAPGYLISLPNGKKLIINTAMGTVSLDFERLAKDYRRDPAELKRMFERGEARLRGFYVQTKSGMGLIEIADTSDPGTLSHEKFHFLFDLALSEKDKNAIKKRYGSEEDAAEAFRRREGFTRTFWEKILAFVGRIRDHLFGDTFAPVEAAYRKPAGMEGVPVAQIREASMQPGTLVSAEEAAAADVSSIDDRREMRDLMAFRKKLMGDVKKRAGEVRKKAEAYKGWQWEVGDKVQSKKTGKIWTVRARSWDTKKDEPLLYMSTSLGEKSSFFVPMVFGEFNKVESLRDVKAELEKIKTKKSFKEWFRKSVVIDNEDKPLTLYRGEHGASGVDKESRFPGFQSRLASLSFFEDSESASIYAESPNHWEDTPDSPRIFPAFIRIENPVMDETGDPFVEFKTIIDAVGLEVAGKIALEVEDHIYNTNNWNENFSDEYTTVEGLLQDAPERLSELYTDAYPIFDSEYAVKEFKKKGYDGAIHGSTGTTFDATEYRVFDAGQVASVFSAPDVKSKIGMPLTYKRSITGEVERAYPENISADIEFTDEEIDTEVLSDFYSTQENELLHVVDTFRKEPSKQQEWDIPPEKKIRELWVYYTTLGKVKDVKGMDKVADQVIKNIHQLKANTILTGHTEQDPDVLMEAAGVEPLSPKELDSFVDHIYDDKQGQMQISDYAMDKLENAAIELMRASSPEAKLVIVDKIFNIVHARTDLSALFIQGGQESLDWLSGRPGYTADIEFTKATDTPGFKKFFGGSKVVRDNKPMIVYHGTGTTIEEFKTEFTGQGNDQLGSGFYFTSEKEQAEAYRTNEIRDPYTGELKPKLGGTDNPNVIGAYLSIKKPIMIEGNSLNDSDVDLTKKQAYEILKASPKIMHPEESPLGDWFSEYWETGPTDQMIKDVAENYTGSSLLTLENDFFGDDATAFRQAVYDATGYDGVIQENEDFTHYVAWFPTQVKSVDNVGTFDPNDPNIRADIEIDPKDKNKLDDIRRPEMELLETLMQKTEEQMTLLDIKPKKGFGKNFYRRNRELVKGRTRMEAIKQELRMLRDSPGSVLDEYLGSISTRLGNIDEGLRRKLRKFEFDTGVNTISRVRRVEPLLRKIKKDMSFDDQIDFDLARKNGDAKMLQNMIIKYNMGKEYSALRKLLDETYKEAKAVGMDVGYREHFHPRVLKDPVGFLRYLKKSEDWDVLSKALADKETELQRYLTEDEKAAVISTMLRGYRTGNVTLSIPGALKERQLETVWPDLNQFYMSSDGALLSYIRTVTDAIESRKFFGKHIKNAVEMGINFDQTNAIDRYVLSLVEEGKIDAEDEVALKEILGARFNQVGTRGMVKLYKTLAYMDTMGSPISALTQIGDLAWAMYKHGPVRTAVEAAKAIARQSEVSKEDLGIERIAEELSDQGGAEKALNFLFKATGLTFMDNIGKETLINAQLSSMLSKAKTEKGRAKLREDMSYLGDELDLAISDLQEGEISENIKLHLFNTLADFQPIALSEMPQRYLTAGNGRLFYMLKTFTLKQFDVFRREAFQKIAKKGTRVEGIKNLVWLAMSFAMMNAGADLIKNIVLNRPTDLEDVAVDNILRTFGASKWMVWKAREEGLFSALVKQILFPVKFADSFVKDTFGRAETAIKERDLPDEEKTEYKGLEMTQSIPWAGKVYYWWFGHGKQKAGKRKKMKLVDRYFDAFATGDNKKIEAAQKEVVAWNLKMVKEGNDKFRIKLYSYGQRRKEALAKRRKNR